MSNQINNENKHVPTRPYNISTPTIHIEEAVPNMSVSKETDKWNLLDDLSESRFSSLPSLGSIDCVNSVDLI